MTSPGCCEVRVLVADDHAIMRAGLERLLRNELEMCLCAMAVDGHSTLARVVDSNCNVLLLDLSMPGPHGPELISQIRRLKPDLPILVMSMHSDPAIVKASLAAGATGYITKDSEPDVLRRALRLVARGEHYLEPSLVQSTLFPPKPAGAPQALSAREVQVLQRLAAGESNAQVARALYLSEKTVSSHKAHIMAKLGFTSLADLIRYADQHLPDDDDPC